MPRGFNQREKDLIHQRLKEKGQELFTRFGLRKTNVEELTRAAGISKGAFYHFYNSKEELFFEILEDFEAKYRAELFANPFPPDKPPRQSLKEVLKTAFTLWSAHPLFQQFNKDDYELLLRKVPPEKVQAHFLDDEYAMVQLIEQAQAAGVTIDCDPRLATGMMKALFLVSFHQEEFDPQEFQRVLDTMIELVVDRLIPEPG